MIELLQQFLRVIGISAAGLAVIVFALAMWEGALTRADGHPSDVRANELHHLYLGLLLILATLPLGGWRWIATLWIGALLMADDAYEHLRQAVEPAFQSPLHQLFAKYLWPLAPVQWLPAPPNPPLGKSAPPPSPPP